MKATERAGPATLPIAATTGDHAETHPVRAAAFAWEDWFRQATFAQQAEALALAQRQGHLYAHQLPAPANGSASHSASHQLAPAADLVDTLRALLAGKVDALTPVTPRMLDGAAAPRTSSPRTSSGLTAAEGCAVARLFASPDLALLRARAGQAAAVLADIATRAARAGQRVLLLAQQPAHLDQVLGRLLDRDPVLPVRFLDAAENAQQLTPSIRACTLDAQRQLFQSHTLAKAHAGRIEAEDRCRRRHDEEQLWPQLLDVALRHQALEQRRQTMLKRLDDAPAEVRREAEGIPGSGKTLPSGPFAMQIVELIKDYHARAARCEQDEQDCERRQVELESERQRLTDECDALRPLCAAKQQGRWWTAAWWRATVTRGLNQRLADLEQRSAATNEALAAMAADLQRLADERLQAEQQVAAERGALVASECERRGNAWRAEIAAIEREQQPLTATWQTLCKQLETEAIPAALTHGAVAEAQSRWHELRQNDEAACLFARQWASFLQESAPQFVAQMPRYASLLAGTVAALGKNPEFSKFTESPFDLVIIVEADRLLENDLLRLARKARRWLLVAQPSSGANGRPSSFDKLWHTLHADPAAHLGYRWSKEANRWCCQLRPVSAKDRPYLENERLADFPEIELRILTLPKARPHLAQVVFPASMTLVQAKCFIHRELQEVAIQPAGRGAWLEECSTHWALHLGGGHHGELTAVELEPGVREWPAASGLTHRVDFAKPDWSFAQVDDWLRRFLNLRDLGRTFELT
ncbi:MAG: hypothetical protein L0Y71_13290 [Gemmataceae bacterium]|nr:hypothetical protein [Gemmataceae bacterium]